MFRVRPFHRREVAGPGRRPVSVERRQRGEVAVVVGRRRPEGLEPPRRHLARSHEHVPGRRAHGGSIRGAIEHGLHGVALARPRVAVLADVGVEPHEPEILALGEPLTREVEDGHDRGLRRIGAPEREGPALQIPDVAELPRSPDQERPEPDVGVAHRERAARPRRLVMRADVGQVRVPRDVDPPREQRVDLRVVVREPDDVHLDGRAAEVSLDAFPDRDHLLVVGDRPDHRSIAHVLPLTAAACPRAPDPSARRARPWSAPSPSRRARRGRRARSGAPCSAPRHRTLASPRR